MSDLKLNLVDSHTILSGTIHGSTGDCCVAGLSAEPESIFELQTALTRFDKDPYDFLTSSMFRKTTELDEEPYDAGILVIDLASRTVACESTYSAPGPDGSVRYSGESDTGIPIFYRVSDDWLFLNSIEEYKAVHAERRIQRLSNPPIDTRAVLYGPPLLNFLALNVRLTSAYCYLNDEKTKSLHSAGAIHAQWLLTPRADLGGRSPRDVLLEKQDFINHDLESRARQWSMQLEGPPCLPRDSFAYRFAGYGTNEWVVYYDLVRYLLTSTDSFANSDTLDFESLVSQLESVKESWLNTPNDVLGDRIPAILIDNERKRLPEAMGGRSMVVDEDCPLCKMMGDECEAGLEVCFFQLDGCNMDDHFAFSTFVTEQEYLEDQIQMELRHREFDQKWKEREERIVRGENVEGDEFLDLPVLDEYVPFQLSEPEPPEA